MQKRDLELGDFHNCSGEFFLAKMNDVLQSPLWLDAFAYDASHGVEHGLNTLHLANELVDNLNPEEFARLKAESEKINSGGASVDAVVQIGAFLHDCGRFADNGNGPTGRGLFAKEVQRYHPEIGAARAVDFFARAGFFSAIPYIHDAVISHEFQNERLTPHYIPGRTFIGDIVRAADQLGWLLPESFDRTLRYNNDIGQPFYSPSASMEERLEWTSSKPSSDSLTVMLCQTFGPTDERRFGTEYSRILATEYQSRLKGRLLDFARERGLSKEVSGIVEEYEARVRELKN